MRFLTYIKQNYKKQTDKDLIAFATWFLKSKMAKNNPHAGITQIILYIDSKKHSPEVLKGFYQWKKMFENGV